MRKIKGKSKGEEANVINKQASNPIPSTDINVMFKRI